MTARQIQLLLLLVMVAAFLGKVHWVGFFDGHYRSGRMLGFGVELWPRAKSSFDRWNRALPSAHSPR